MFTQLYGATVYKGAPFSLGPDGHVAYQSFARRHARTVVIDDPGLCPIQFWRSSRVQPTCFRHPFVFFFLLLINQQRHQRRTSQMKLVVILFEWLWVTSSSSSAITFLTRVFFTFFLLHLLLRKKNNIFFVCFPCPLSKRFKENSILKSLHRWRSNRAPNFMQRHLSHENEGPLTPCQYATGCCFRRSPKIYHYPLLAGHKTKTKRKVGENP